MQPFRSGLQSINLRLHLEVETSMLVSWMGDWAAWHCTAMMRGAETRVLDLVDAEFCIAIVSNEAKVLC